MNSSKNKLAKIIFTKQTLSFDLKAWVIKKKKKKKGLTLSAHDNFENFDFWTWTLN